MQKVVFTACSIILLAALLTGCKKADDGNDDDDNFDRKALLTNYADNYVVPAYQDMVQKLDDFKAAVDQFTAGPDEAKLVTAQNKWKDAYVTWQKVEQLEFGPAEDVSLRMFMNIYPASVTRINSNLTAGAYDLNAFGNKDAQGFPALDYLLNGLAGTNQLIVAYYTTDAQATNRKQYLQDVTAHMVAMITNVSNQWTSYRNSFIENTGTDASSSFSGLVNSYVLYYERYLRSGKIGLPVGAMSGVAMPELTEAYYTPSLSKELALTSLAAVKAFYEGKSYDNSTDGNGMRDYFAAIGTKDESGKLLADVVTDEVDQVITGVQGLNGTIRNAVSTNRPAVLAIYDELQDVVPLLKVDMVSAFGISITYVDNDGD